MPVCVHAVVSRFIFDILFSAGGIVQRCRLLRRETVFDRRRRLTSGNLLHRKIERNIDVFAYRKI